MGAVEPDGPFARDEPATAVRGVHLDLKGSPPTFERLLRLLEIFAALRFNAVLVEWEDMFPWTADMRFRCETCYTPQQVVAFRQKAAALGLEVVPLVQCLGHMETPLSPSGRENLREVPHRSDVLNCLADGARELVERMVEDVLVAFPDVKHFHLGGDEAWTFGTHPDTKAYIAAHGRGELYLHHVGPLLEKLNARGIRPILWHDMMREFSDAALRDLAGRADLCVWGYRGHPDTTGHHYNTKYIRRFAEAGICLWGATAYKGATDPAADRPRLDWHAENAAAWVEIARRFDMRGLFATAWSRYSTHNVHCETIEASLDSLVNVAVILHDGAPPAGGGKALLDALRRLGEAERFEACRDAMERLSELRDAGWRQVRQLRERLTMATLDARRRSGGLLCGTLASLRQTVAEADGTARRTREALAGRIEPLWTDRYLAERIEPLRAELAQLDAAVRLLDRPGWEAIGA